MNHELVAGESVDALRRPFAAFDWRRRPNGRVNVSVQLDRELGEALARALMRVEAELLLHDADLIGRPDTVLRSPEERRVDALVALGLRLADAP